jgi:hypothetical protein
MQPKRLASQEKLWHKTPSPRRIGSRVPLGLCGGLSFFCFLISFFDYFPSFFLFSFLFLTYRTTEQGWGDREAAARRMCARGSGWMSSGDEKRVSRKDGTKGRKHK